MAFDADARVTAVLGPTNTGKTHYAIERMLAHRTGVIGLPLRLLAREVYDRIVSLRGPSVVALVTGEERIVPPRTAYWVCTVEAMPTDIGADFLAVDEIQLCGDPDRGHIFTDRLLNARGLHETLFLGSDIMRPRIASLVPGQQMLRRERFSKLSYTGPRKISRMPPRSAVVGFSVEDVYAIAELIRRQRGGAAVVMGALSPAHPQRPGRALPERRRRPPGRDRRDRHGAEPRHRARRLLGPREVRRPPPPPPRRPRAGPDRRARGALHHRRHLRRHRRGRPARARGGRGDREPPLPAARPAAVAQLGPRLRHARAAGREPGGAGRPPGPAARPRGRRPRDAEGAERDARRPRPAARARGRAAALGRLPDPRLPQGDARRAREPLRPALPLPARRRRHPDRVARPPDRADRSNRRRHRRVVEAAGVYPHMDLRGAAQGLDRRRRPLARRDPCGRRPAVGCAARAADPAFRRPAHQRADAPAEAEGEPVGDCDRKRRGLDRRPVHRPARRLPLPARPDGRRRPGPDAARRRPRGARPGALASGPTSSTTPPTPRST